jgi:hemoglobin
MKSDIAGIEDIKILVQRFYEKVNADELLAPLFAHVNWETHLPVMYSFWESVLLGTGSYSGNTMKVHQDLHEHSPLNEQYFERWLQLFTANINELFEGEKAEQARQRAMSIATVMRMKLFYPGSGLR